MPRYNYLCISCNSVVEIIHSMTDVATDCTVCEAKGTLKKQLTIPRINSAPTPPKTGAVVKKAIKDYKQRISDERGVWDDFDVESLLEEKK
jgi:putative FmdB family regulatory protein